MLTSTSSDTNVSALFSAELHLPTSFVYVVICCACRQKSSDYLSRHSARSGLNNGLRTINQNKRSNCTVLGFARRRYILACVMPDRLRLNVHGIKQTIVSVFVPSHKVLRVAIDVQAGDITHLCMSIVPMLWSIL